MNDGDALLRAIHLFPFELAPQLEYLDWANENRQQVRDAIEEMVRREPRFRWLCCYGLGYRNRKHDELAEGYRRDFEASRERLLRSWRAVSLSRVWIARRSPLQSPCSRGDSYHFKHCVEYYWRDEKFEALGDTYVPEGAFIAAALLAGLPWRPVQLGSTSLRIGISRRDPKPPKPERRVR